MSSIKLNAKLRAYSNASIEAPLLNVDSNLSETSKNPVQNKVITSALDKKVDKEVGKTLTSNDFTDELKDKLDSIEVDANKTVVDSELSDTSENPVENKVIAASLSDKVDKENGKGLSSNDFTTELKDKLDEVEAGANKTIVDGELSDTSLNPVENKTVTIALTNKMTTPDTDGVVIVQNKQISTIEALSVEDTRSLFNSVCGGLMSRKTSMPGKGVK